MTVKKSGKPSWVDCDAVSSTLTRCVVFGIVLILVSDYWPRSNFNTEDLLI
jgi:hypothetical protein